MPVRSIYLMVLFKFYIILRVFWAVFLSTFRKFEICACADIYICFCLGSFALFILKFYY